MKTPINSPARIIALALAAGVLASQSAEAQSSWSGANLGTDMNWSDAANWNTLPTSSSSVTFPDGAYPITTNIQGAVNNVVSANTTIASLIYNNNGAGSHFVTTQIPSGNTLTVNGNVSIGNAAVAVTTTYTGGGSLIAGSGGSVLAVQSTSGTAFLDLSALTNFSFNAGGSSSGSIQLSTQGSSSSGKINLANGSNNITCGTLSLGNNNNGGTGTMNLGNGTNVINADTIDMAMDKTAGTMQFLNNNGGGLKLASHTGTGRATINLGSVANSGSTSAKVTASMLFNGGYVNILASTMTVGNRGNRAASGGNGFEAGVLSFNNGVVDATTVNMATSSSSGAGFGTISVGTAGTLRIGSGGLMMVNATGTNSNTGTLIATNGASVTCNYNIYKGTSAGTAVVTMASSTLTLGGSMGVTNGNFIDFFNVTNSTLNLTLATTPAISAINLNANATTQNTINISAIPVITVMPAQFQIITYTTGSGNLNSFVLGTLPPNFMGYVSNNLATSSIDLVLTNGPVAKSDEWGGGVNNQWDTTSLNWTNAGVAVTYNDLDDVVFDDLAQTPNVNITSSRSPATWTMQNSSLNYVFSGAGRITGPVQLVMSGTASVMLAETGGDNFSGGIAAEGGKVILDDTNGAISGGVTISGTAVVQIGNNDGSGNLPGGTIANNGDLIFARTNNFSTGTAISGGGSVTQNGTGTLTLTANESAFTGATLVNAGTLALTGSGAIANSSEVNVSNAALDVSGVTSIAIMTTVDLTNAVLDLKAGYLQTNFNMTSLNLGGTGNVINVKSLPAIVFYPATIPLIHSANTIVGYNFTLGSLPTSTPAYAGSISESADQTSVLLTLTAGPTNSRPSVTWDGNDALANGNTNWSDAQNWLSPGTPMAAEKATFNDTAAVGGSPFGGFGQGGAGIVNPGNVNNYVDISLTNAGLSYVNASDYQNTQISPGNTLTENGSVTVTGAGSGDAVLGAGGTLVINNVSGATLAVANGTAPTLDMSGLGTLNANVSQIGVGFNPASVGSKVFGVWYLAQTNYITSGPGNFGTASALVVGGGTGSTAGTGTVYLGQSNVLNLDGIVLGVSTSTGDSITFNPNLTGNPTAYIRGELGGSSRVTLWSLGDDTVNINNGAGGFGHINDFSVGTLNAMVATLIVGQGCQGNEANNNIMGTFNMGAGNLDVTTLEIGVADNGKTGGTGIGVVNVTGGSLEVNTLEFAIGTPATTAGTLNLTNATLVVSNGVTIGTGNVGGSLGISTSTVKILNGAIGSAASGLVNLNLDGGTLQVNVDGHNPSAEIVATNVTTGATTTINLAAIANVYNTVQLPLLSYVGADPFAGLQLGTCPAGYTVTLVDDTANSSVDVNIVSPLKSNPHIASVSVSGPTLNITATGGAANTPYVLLGTTNLALPLKQWNKILTNNLDGSGNLNLSTNIIQSTVGTEYFDVSQ